MFWENLQSNKAEDSRPVVAEGAIVVQYDNVSLGVWFTAFHFGIH
jgi:hypothetical protein